MGDVGGQRVCPQVSDHTLGIFLKPWCDLLEQYYQSCKPERGDYEAGDAKNSAVEKTVNIAGIRHIVGCEYV